MVDPVSKSLLVLYDDTQSIYQKKRRRFNFASVGIEAVGRTSVLRLNYRNTAEVMALAVHCAQSLLQPGAGVADEFQRVVPDSAGRRGPMPVLIEARSERDEAELIAERIAAAHADGRPLGEIAILLPMKLQMQAFEAALRTRGIAVRSMAAGALRSADWADASVKLLTLHSSKGLEFAEVFVGGLQAMPHRGEPIDEELRLLYVAMTRATHALVLSAHGRSQIVTKVRESLEAVGAVFAAA
jgi:superfamily I DNA/RNA helicase